MLNTHRRMVRYRSVKADQTPLLMRIRDLARVRVRYGYFRIYILLRREGWVRESQAGASAVPRGRPEPSAQAAAPPRDCGHGEARTPAGAPNDLWLMDFVSDALFDGRRLRALTVVDAYTCEALKIAADQGIKGEQVVFAMAQITAIRGAPEDHPDRQRPEIRLEGARPLCLRERRHAQLLAGRQAHRQRLRRVLGRHRDQRLAGLQSVSSRMTRIRSDLPSKPMPESSGMTT